LWGLHADADFHRSRYDIQLSEALGSGIHLVMMRALVENYLVALGQCPAPPLNAIQPCGTRKEFNVGLFLGYKGAPLS
jgi:hypothetical protein